MVCAFLVFAPADSRSHSASPVTCPAATWRASGRLAALDAAGTEAEGERFLIQSRDKAKDSALRARLEVTDVS